MPWGQIFIYCIKDNHNSWKTTLIVSLPFINHWFFLFIECPFSFAHICVFQIAIPKTPDKALCSLQCPLTLCKKHFSYYCYNLEKEKNKTKPLRENITKNLLLEKQGWYTLSYKSFSPFKFNTDAISFQQSFFYFSSFISYNYRFCLITHCIQLWQSIKLLKL